MNNHSNSVDSKFKFYSSNCSHHTFFITKKKKIFSTGSNSFSERLIGSKKRTPITLKSMETVDPTKVIKISCGTSFTVVLTKGNEGNNIVQVVGLNEDGQLSLGDERNRKELTKVGFLKEKKIINVFGGFSVNYFISKDNEVYSCGWNKYGQLGLGDRKNRNIAQKIIGISKIVDISCGGFFVVFLNQNCKVFISGYVNNLNNNLAVLSPKLIECKEKIIEISAGRYHFLALGKSKRVYGVGDDTFKQLLRNGESNSLIELSYFNDLKVKSIMCCLATSFVLSKDGTVRAWGGGKFNQFGNGETTDRSSPIVVKNNIFQMFCTQCGIFLFEKNGDVYFTGNNGETELGKKGEVKFFEKSKNIKNVDFEKRISFFEIQPIKTYSSISEISLCFDKFEIKFSNSSYSVLIDCCYAIRSPVLKKEIEDKKQSIIVEEKQYFNVIEFIEGWLKTDVFEVKELNVNLIKGIYVIAKRWKLFNLSRKVIKSVKKLDVESVISLIFLLCEENSDSALYLKCIHFLKDNHNNVLKHSKKLFEYGEKGEVFRNLSLKICQLCHEALTDVKKHFEFTLNENKVVDLEIHLINLLGDENSKDLCFKCLDGLFIKVHKKIITKKCEYFKKMLTTQFKEANQKIVDVNVHSKVLIPIITYFYSNSINIFG